MKESLSAKRVALATSLRNAGLWPMISEVPAFRIQLALHQFVVDEQLPPFDRPVDRVEELVDVVGLRQEVVGPHLDGLDGGLHVRVVREDDDLSGGGVFLEELQNFDPADAGHADVEQDNVVDLRLDQVDRLAPVRGGVYGELFGLSEFTFEDDSKRFFVVDNEEIVLLCHGPPLPDGRRYSLSTRSMVVRRSTRS